MNQYFASYVREASFNLSLSSEMINTLLQVDHELKNPRPTENDTFKRDCVMILHRSTSTALYRRGLVIPTTRTDFPKAWLESQNWPYYYELTDAGRLVVGLLKEAGFAPPEERIPPPYEHDNYEVKVSLKQ